ncbi:hypothetical protein LCGC14_0475390 [marine sediment metagenome]|uniref:Uncharacterized protein n=1 Tax=marine sediment metagenome TaxID=412755 RepID=A0A0F9UXU6_9ZZZZ
MKRVKFDGLETGDFFKYYGVLYMAIGLCEGVRLTTKTRGYVRYFSGLSLVRPIEATICHVEDEIEEK